MKHVAMITPLVITKSLAIMKQLVIMMNPLAIMKHLVIMKSLTVIKPTLARAGFRPIEALSTKRFWCPHIYVIQNVNNDKQ